jgi:hypothetical protein
MKYIPGRQLHSMYNLYGAQCGGWFQYHCAVSYEYDIARIELR